MNEREFAESMKGGYKLLLPRNDLELGYINGYRRGVEYQTNGQKPDLPDDVLITGEYNFLPMEFAVPVEVGNAAWGDISKFKITDQRYKPADTSYLVSEITESKPNAENVSIDPITELRKEFSSLSPAFQKLMQSDFDRLIEDMERFIKDKAEKKRAVDAAFASLSEFNKAHQVLGELYDAGFLRMPAN